MLCNLGGKKEKKIIVYEIKSSLIQKKKKKKKNQKLDVLFKVYIDSWKDKDILCIPNKPRQVAA